MRILKARRLLTQDAFCDVAVEEGVGYIQLVRWPVLGRDEREDDTDRGGFDDRGEGFAEVDPRPLMKPAHHPSSFVTLEGAIGAQLVFEDPFTRDDLSTGRPWHKSPRAVMLESIKLLLHGVTPWGILERRTYRPQNGTDGRSVAGKGVSRVWLDDAGSCSSDHLVLGRSWCSGLLGCRGV